MTPDQYWLCKIAEECTEVGQRALKAQQFGLGEIQSGQNRNNLDRLLSEFHDLVITVEEMFGRINPDIDVFPNEQQRKLRLEKMDMFLELAISLNQVDPNTNI